MTAKFRLGTLVMTRQVNDRVAEDTKFAKFVIDSLRRHACGDWGDVTQDDKAENDFALKEGNLRLFSSYETPGLPKIWVISEFDRTATTVLFPDDY